MADVPDSAIVQCVDCGTDIHIYPPEDGHDNRWRCGRCARFPVAVRA